jgi:hypothetical protein
VKAGLLQPCKLVRVLLVSFLPCTHAHATPLTDRALRRFLVGPNTPTRYSSSGLTSGCHPARSPPSAGAFPNILQVVDLTRPDFFFRNPEPLLIFTDMRRSPVTRR